jgi:hypothetical protein
VKPVIGMIIPPRTTGTIHNDRGEVYANEIARTEFLRPIVEIVKKLLLFRPVQFFCVLSGGFCEGVLPAGTLDSPGFAAELEAAG